MKYIPLNDTIVKGSHGRINTDPEQYPIIVSQKKQILKKNYIEAIEVFDILKAHLGINNN